MVGLGSSQRPPGHAPMEPRPHLFERIRPALHPPHPGTASFEGSPSLRLTGPGVPGIGPGVNPYEPAPTPPLPSVAYHRPLSPGLSFPTHQSMSEYSSRGSHGSQAHPAQLPPLHIDTRYPGDSTGPRGAITSSSSPIRSHESPIMPVPRHYSSGASRHPAEHSPVSPQNLPPPPLHT